VELELTLHHTRNERGFAHAPRWPMEVAEAWAVGLEDATGARRLHSVARVATVYIDVDIFY